MRILSTLMAGLVSVAFSVPTAMAQDDPFIDWLNDFRPRLVQSGASPQTVRAMLDGLEPEMRIIDRDRDQPEFVRPLWEYLDIAASDLRTANGLETFADNRETLEAIEARFGVDAEILVAIWGLESSYGQIMGDNDVVQALATLAWEGRRRSWAEAQLIAVGRMLDRGYADRSQLTGSWAGAMGQTQFIPETYLARASILTVMAAAISGPIMEMLLGHRPIYWPRRAGLWTPRLSSKFACPKAMISAIGHHANRDWSLNGHARHRSGRWYCVGHE